MASSTSKSYLSGFMAGLPFVVVVIPFAMLFGVVATEAGLNLAEVMGFSVLVIAGAAQFTALQLMLDQAPVVLIIATSLIVNLRMAMYSAAITPYLGHAPFWQRAILAYLLVDQSYAVSQQKFEDTPDMTVPSRVAYFLGVISPVAPMWYLGSLIGALAGQQIPESWAIDFALPICFLAVIAPGLKSLAHVAAAGTAVVLSLLLAWVPYSGGVILAGLAAMAVGAETERRMAR